MFFDFISSCVLPTRFPVFSVHDSPYTQSEPSAAREYTIETFFVGIKYPRRFDSAGAGDGNGIYSGG